MSKIKDKKTIREMVMAIDQYLLCQAGLTPPVQNLELGIRSLDSVSDDRKEIIFNEWLELEIAYSTILERIESKEAPTREEALMVRDILTSIKSMLNDEDKIIEEHFCPSCGADLSDSSVWSTKKESSDFCYCCGLKFNRQRPTVDEVKSVRDRWLLHPEFWKESNVRPDNWKIEDQISNIPEEYL